MVDYFHEQDFTVQEEYLPSAVWARRHLLCSGHWAICILGASSLAIAGSTQGTPPQPVSAALNRIQAEIVQGGTERNQGRLLLASETFGRAAQEAETAGDVRTEAKALMLRGACEIDLFQYRQALISLARARQLAFQEQDITVEGGVALNLSSAYEMLGDFSAARSEAEQAVQALQRSTRQDYLIKALLNLANIQSDQGDLNSAIAAYDRAGTLAHRAGRPDSESLALDERGISLVLAHRLPEAEAALSQAKTIRVRYHDENLAFSIEHLAELELVKGHYVAGLKLIDEALNSRSHYFKTGPQYYPVHIRGELLLSLGRKSEALTEFRRAVELADEWRQGALPGDATSIRTSSHLHDVYQDYIELAAQLSLERRDANLGRLAWEVLAASRAAALREQMSLALEQAGRLPPKYFELLSKLQQAQAQFTMEEKPEDEANVDRIRLELSSLENQIGIQKWNFAQYKERIPHKKSLRNIQSRLTVSEVLLSFCLGRDKSFLWTVTSDHVNLYQLSAALEIGRQAEAFSYAVRHSENISEQGQFLSKQLFGKFGANVWRRPNWLIAADGPLLSGVPFAALPSAPFSGPSTPLISGHTLRFLPSELLLLTGDTNHFRPSFVGIGDPIYNLADSRQRRNVSVVKAKQNESALVLARLAGSDVEIRNAAKQSGMDQIELLEGPKATGVALQSALRERPEVVHFAVHVVSPKGRPEEAGLALSLTQENVPELLTSEVIATYRLPGSLVVMSGCSSDQGETVPSAGVIGLSRAWLLAGAGAVIVSAWPTPDDSGRFFSSFYGHLQSTTSKTGSLVKGAALALQQTQLEMQRSSGYRNSPSFWAAYSVISKE